MLSSDILLVGSSWTELEAALQVLTVARSIFPCYLDLVSEGSKNNSTRRRGGNVSLGGMASSWFGGLYHMSFKLGCGGELGPMHLSFPEHNFCFSEFL